MVPSGQAARAPLGRGDVSDIEGVVAFPVGEVVHEGVPLLHLELEISRRELLAHGGLEARIGVIGADRVEKVQGQLRRALDLVALGIHVDVVARARIGVGLQPRETRGDDDGLQQIRVHRAVGQPQLEPAGARHAHHMGAVVAGPGHGIGRPGGARERARRVDPLVAVHRRVGDDGERRGVLHDAAQESAAAVRQAELLGVIGKGVLAGRAVPHRDMGVAAVAGQALNGLRHEGRAQPVLFRDRFHHELEEAVLVGGGHRAVVFPVHLELAVRILVVVLIGLPAELEHVIADLGDHVIAAHHRLLVVAGLRRGVGRVRDRQPVGAEQEELGLDAGLHLEPHFGGLGNEAGKHVARRLRKIGPLHHAIRGDPGDIALPGQLDHRGRIRHREHVGMRRRQVEMRREARKARAARLHLGNRRGRHQLRPLRAEQVGVGDHEVFHALFTGEGGKIGHRRFPVAASRASRALWPFLT
ncbi:hypothetical protein SDC9_54148 [bioreactor metagenome]|uniref:Uncharacterized protein n=1 Tax=bioreactor metagenome TaxID=1076179 RepID=A0A644WVN4_9ZZZZ